MTESANTAASLLFFSLMTGQILRRVFRQGPVTAHRIQGKSVMLLSGVDAQDFQESTARLAKCFPADDKLETKLDLSPSGFGIINASIEQSEAYGRGCLNRADFLRRWPVVLE